MNLSGHLNLVTAIQAFWFGEPDAECFGYSRPEWFGKNAAFDAQIKAGFGQDIEAASRGQRDTMANSPEGAVALVVLLDQFPRNIYRGDARSFAQDAHALKIAKSALDKGFDQDVLPMMRSFLYLPFEHSETIEDQERAVALFMALGDASLADWAVRHHDIIVKFGRFPHRNAILGRNNTPEEDQFLAQPGSSF